MKTLSVIKKDLEFNRGLSSLIEVLKNIAVSQYRALEQRIKTYEAFLRTVESFFGGLDAGLLRHPFVHMSDRPQLVVAITSDSGLLGGLNMQVITRAIDELSKVPGRLVVVGERGKSYARENKMPFVAFPGIREEQRYSQAIQLRDYCMKVMLEEQFGHWKVVYPHPVSFTVQKIETVTFVPFAIPNAAEPEPSAGPMIVESAPDDLVEYLVYLWAGQKMYELFGFSRLSEYAARYVHLEESLQRLKEMDTKMRLEYFRVRHELIDRNMRELFSARLLYAQ